MKKLLTLVLACLLFVSINIFSQEGVPSPEPTPVVNNRGYLTIDGTVWIKLERQAKVNIVVGYYTAMDTLMIMLEQTIKPDDKHYDAYYYIYTFCNMKIAVSDLINKIDMFYLDEKKLTDPIFKALAVCTGRYQINDEQTETAFEH
jgi:hypothetical protein